MLPRVGGAAVAAYLTSYLDREAAKPYRGPAPQGHFLDGAPSTTSGLTGSVPGQ